MFETPTLDITEIKSTLTEAGHTAVGFATMAAKKANDVRLDLTDRYEDSLVDIRKQALVIVKRVEEVRADVEARVEPMVTRVVDRLPEPAQKLINDATDAAKGLQSKSYDFVVKALAVDTTVAAATTSAKAKAATKAKTTTKPAAKNTAGKTTAAKTPVAKAAKSAARATAKPAAKAAVRKVAAKTAPKAATA